MALKKLGSAGRYGPRYGRKLKKRIIDVEQIQKSKHKCPFCSKLTIKRHAAGIWYCKSCNTKFAAKAYDPSIIVGKPLRPQQEEPVKEEKKEEPKKEKKAPKTKIIKEDPEEEKEEKEMPEEITVNLSKKEDRE